MSNEIRFLRELASVRPGLPSKALREMVGALWREPLPHQQGQVLCIEHSHGFSAQIDSDGIVGRVEFGREWSDPPFSSEVDISGLRCGMSLENARRARPDLTIHPGKHPMPTGGIAKLDEHTRLRLRFLESSNLLTIEPSIQNSGQRLTRSRSTLPAHRSKIRISSSSS